MKKTLLVVCWFGFSIAAIGQAHSVPDSAAYREWHTKDVKISAAMKLAARKHDSALIKKLTQQRSALSKQYAQAIKDHDKAEASK